MAATRSTSAKAKQIDKPDAPRQRRAYLPAHERRRLIIEAAQQVFARSNLQGARTRDIAKAAEVNQATVFEHFESKEALFHEAVVLPLMDAMRGMHARAQAYEAAHSFEEMQAVAQESAQRNLESMTEIFPLLTAALFSDLELGKKLYVDQILPILKQRAEALQGVIKEDLDPEFVELSLFGMLFALAMDQTLRGKRRDPRKTARQITKFAMTGFAKQPDGD
jgi:AcrR family transcriptional regulator